MKLIFEVVWSDKWYYPPASIIRDGKYPALRTNRFKKFTYRLKPRIV